MFRLFPPVPAVWKFPTGAFLGCGGRFAYSFSRMEPWFPVTNMVSMPHSTFGIWEGRYLIDASPVRRHPNSTKSSVEIICVKLVNNVCVYSIVWTTSKNDLCNICSCICPSNFKWDDLAGFPIIQDMNRCCKTPDNSLRFIVRTHNFYSLLINSSVAST